MTLNIILATQRTLFNDKNYGLINNMHFESISEDLNREEFHLIELVALEVDF